ncbi:hypothetical protein B0T14DRAFT_526708 [Immersiella caudata]|uniref:Uncharacterized protein n=1 Tax=Immersiella caudata TaxID=314043 RepID=A0AA39WE26_9PEZI|nr:hypothetical protein B0T14DRAFT_526708 [Immersiella caudata]
MMGILLRKPEVANFRRTVTGLRWNQHFRRCSIRPRSTSRKRRGSEETDWNISTTATKKPNFHSN